MNKIALDFSSNFFGSSGHFLSTLPGAGTLVSVLLSNAIIIAGIVFVILIILGGLQMIGSSGKSPQEIAKGRETIFNAIIGFIIVIASYWIVRLVESSFGVNIFG